jgi:hypothetical protein
MPLPSRKAEKASPSPSLAAARPIRSAETAAKEAAGDGDAWYADMPCTD